MTPDVAQPGDDVPSLEDHREQLRGIAERAEQAAVVGPVATDGGQKIEQTADGPHECPFDEDYHWWFKDGDVYVDGHHIVPRCDCGSPMGSPHKEGEALVVHCEADDCDGELTLMVENVPLARMYVHCRCGTQLDGEATDDGVATFRCDGDSPYFAHEPREYSIESETLAAGGEA
ncbi:hypothetical protein [Halomicrobium salinisoli]|uniref:hypothetical protein n=1 Tax=Halomicrobium salinisoli TaxID=2878391 RepID=UPI001CF015DB|nr:hypothetical protein [Halomicrobium salinisoli]